MTSYLFHCNWNKSRQSSCWITIGFYYHRVIVFFSRFFTFIFIVLWSFHCSVQFMWKWEAQTLLCLALNPFSTVNDLNQFPKASVGAIERVNSIWSFSGEMQTTFGFQNMCKKLQNIRHSSWCSNSEIHIIQNQCRINCMNTVCHRDTLYSRFNQQKEPSAY